MNSTLTLPDFCVPRPGSTTLHRVISGALSRVLGELGELLRVHAQGPWRADIAEFSRVVGSLVRREPGALAAVVRRPEVAVWIRCLRSKAPHAVEPALAIPTVLATIALELARCGALPGPLRLTHVPPRIVSGLGRIALRIPSDTTALRFGPGSLEVHGTQGIQTLSLLPDDDAFIELRGAAVRLALVDDNPLAALEAHPDKAGNALDLGQQPVSRWRAALESAFETVGTYLPAFRSELELALQQIIPVGWDPEQHFSASIQESIGTIYLSLHPNPMTMVEAVIHEVSHNKLAALLELDPILDNAHNETYASPVRPDPRPLHGVLLAVHAFLPVAALYAAMVEARAEGSDHPAFVGRFEEIVRGNHEAAEVLREHARPTALGRQLLDEIDALTR